MNTQCPFLPKGGLGANLCQVCKGFLADIDPFGLSADLDYLKTAPLLVTDAQILHHECRYLILRHTCFISCGVYNMVRIIMTLSSKSRGIPCGEVMSSVPLMSKLFTNY